MKEIDREFFDEIRFLGNFHYPVSDENDEPYVILPTTRNPMWVIPIQNRTIAAVSLALYQPSLLRAKFLKQLAILLARSGLLRVLIREKVYLKKNDDEIERIFKRGDLYYAVFMGTEGPHKKVTVQVMDQGGTILGYIKASDNTEVEKLLTNEMEILTDLRRLEIRSALLPRVLYYGEIKNVKALFLDSLKSVDSTFSSKLSASHIEFLTELFEKTSTIKNFRESDFFVGLQSRIKKLESYLSDVWKQRFMLTLNYLQVNIGDELIPVGLCHRDFTPWNTFFHDGNLFVFDWEYTARDYPPLLDVLHFVIQDGIVVRHLSPASLLKRITKNQRLIDKYCDLIDIDKSLLNLLLLCYLIDISLLYIEREKGSLNGEVKKRIETWGEMIDLLLGENRNEKN